MSPCLGFFLHRQYWNMITSYYVLRITYYVLQYTTVVSLRCRVKNPKVYVWTEGPGKGLVKIRTKRAGPPPYNISLYYGANVSISCKKKIVNDLSGVPHAQAFRSLFASSPSGKDSPGMVEKDIFMWPIDLFMTFRTTLPFHLQEPEYECSWRDSLPEPGHCVPHQAGGRDMAGGAGQDHLLDQRRHTIYPA